MSGHKGGGRAGRGMPMGGEKPKNFKQTIGKLAGYLGGFRKQILAVWIFAACSAAFSIVGPKLLGNVTSKVFEGVMGGGGVDFGFIGRTILWLIGLYLVSAGFSYLQGWLMSGVTMKITYRLRRDIAEKINRLPLKYFDTRTHGEVLSRITNDVDTISQTLNQSLTQLITAVATIVGVLIMMLSISRVMTLASVFILPVSAGLILVVVKASQKYFREQQEYLGHMNGNIEENYAGHNVVQAFCGEQDAIDEFSALNEKLYDSAWISQFLSGMMMPIMSFVGNLGYVMVCVLGGFLAAQQLIRVGDVQAFIQYVRNFTQPVAQLANISNTLQSTAAAAERVFEFLDEAEEVPDVSTPADPRAADGSVAFRGVHFGYAPERTIINDFSCAVAPGQSIAIVGPTGAGKSTIVKLLMRFYDTQSGEILVGGRPIRSYTREGLRSMFGMVLQDTWLYHETIMENIRYGSFDKTDAQVIAAAKAAHCDEFIRALPGGYQMVLGEDAANISQGQKQLLTIARTILSDPKILILDEATSSVDTRTEVMIQKAMDALMQGRTSFVIAHRLSTIRGASNILVMRDGDIVEQGTHDALLAADGFYASLYRSQFEAGEQPA